MNDQLMLALRIMAGMDLKDLKPSDLIDLGLSASVVQDGATPDQIRNKAATVVYEAIYET